MKPTSLFLVTAAIASAPLLTAQTTYVWDNGGATAVVNTAENWEPDATPTSTADWSDTARWNGTAAGDLTMIFTEAFGGGPGTAGVILDVTALQTGSLAMTGNTIRVRDITIAAGAGAVTLGPIQIGGLGSTTAHTITNNSAHNVIQGTLLKGGGGLRDVTLTGSGNYTINGVINPSVSNDSNGFNLIKSGTGTLFITADNFNQPNVWNSKLTINTGAVRISNSGALGAAGSGEIGVTSIAGGAATGRLELIGGISVAEILTINAKNAGIDHLVNVSGNNTLSGNLTWFTGGVAYGIRSDAGKLTLSGAMVAEGNSKTLNVGGAGDLEFTGAIGNTTTGTLTVTKSGAGTLTLSGTNTYTGVTTVSGGALNAGTNAAGLAPGSNLTFNGGVLGASGTFARTLGTAAGEVQWLASAKGGFAAVGGALTVTLNGGAALNWSVNGPFGGGTLVFGSAGADNKVTLTNGFVLNANRTIQVDSGAGGDSAEISGIITHAGSGITKTGTGILILSGANTYGGVTNVNAGTLQVAHNAALGSTAGNTSILSAGGGKLAFSGNVSVAENITINARNTGDHLQNVSGNNALSGTLTWGSGGTSYGVRSDAGKLTINGSVSPLLGAKNLNISGAGDTEFTGVIGNAETGNVTVVKTGSGTLTLSNANTYSGDTTVSEGKLLVNNSSGSGTGSGAVSVSSGATFGGTGAISGALNVTGVLSPGASIETLSSGSLTHNNGSTFAHEIDSSAALSTGSDLQRVNGGLTLLGTVGLTLSDVALTEVAFALGTTFSLINYTGSWNNGLFTFGGDELSNNDRFTTGLNTWEITYNAADGGSNFAGEYAGGADSFVNITAVPEPAAALLGGLGVLLLLRRRRELA